MKRVVLIASGTAVGLGGSLLIAHALIGSQSPPPSVISQTKEGITTSATGTFVGSAVDVSYGTIQVEIKVVHGKIVDAQARQSPTGRSARFSGYAIPVLREQTLAAQSANIQGATGASYTSFGWKTSLRSAMTLANL